MWWQPDNYKSKLQLLEKRVSVIKAIRSYFDGEGFLEVETPALQIAPGMETHLHAFQTNILTPRLEHRGQLYLHTSPEFAMKKLLVAGLEKIYNICHCYRNAEQSHLHSCEFTMIEWYRAHAGYEDIMDDCIRMHRLVAEKLGISHFKYNGLQANPFEKWQKISVCDAFVQYANIDITPVLDDKKEFAKLAQSIDIQTDPSDRWDDIFFRIFLRDIEPQLGHNNPHNSPTILYDYPISMAALSRPKPSDPRFAERFEIYICGLELANAFGELTDPHIQRERYIHDMDLKQELYGHRWPVDEDFLKALEYGMPESGGIALGVDRLVMLVCGVDTIDDILWCPKP